MSRNSKLPYIRVGTKYYKVVELPDLTGKSFEKKIIPWSKDNITTDFKDPKSILRRIPKYDSFITVPDHLSYQSEIGSCYNLYHPLSHKPESGDLTYTIKYLTHVFGDQLELAYDYFALLLLKPTEMLPILCLVSKEPNTGKSTLLKWLKEIFGHNFTFNSNDDLRSRFNTDWTSKLIIGIEETLLDKREDSEKIKNLSTASLVKTEAKGIDKIEIPFFGKLILCSNNETNFVSISQDEDRYWVRKLYPLKNKDPFMEEKIKNEIPAFLHFLIKRGIQYEKKNRMWFAPEDIYTDALQKLKNDNASIVEKEMKEIISELLALHNLDEIHFTVDDLLIYLKQGGIRNINRNYVSSILRDNWKLNANKSPSTYKYYFSDLTTEVSYIQKQGRYYTFHRSNFLDFPKITQESKSIEENIEKITTPF